MTYKVRRLPILTMSAAILFAASAVSAGAAPVPYAPQPSVSGPMRVTTQSSPARTQVLNLAKGRSAVIDLPADASDVFVSNPAVADAVLRTPRRIFVLGVAPGQSDAIFFDGMGRQILNLSVHVEAPTDNLADAVHRLFPDSHIDVQSLNGHIV
ncbi:MAG: pilus assembly protein N-terminal domain-containing protein, partial [Asticcacaulis sp.]|nr:pilus assembly protein N-terminal domain-containing protein [Asticcacaulis sp.]